MSKIRESYGKMSDAINTMYKDLVEYVKEHQGSKGYIDTQDMSCDTMYFYEYDSNDFVTMYESRVCAVRVVDNELQVIGTIYGNLVFTEDDIKAITERSDNNNNYDNCETYWKVIYCSDTIAYVPTLVSIADCIEEYCED